MAKLNVTYEQKKFIYDNHKELTAKEMALHLNLTRQCIWKHLRLKDIKCKVDHIKRPVNDKRLVAAVLEAFVNNGYSVKLAAESSCIGYQKACKYVSEYYTRKRLIESTVMITKQSKI